MISDPYAVFISLFRTLLHNPAMAATLCYMSYPIILHREEIGKILTIKHCPTHLFKWKRSDVLLPIPPVAGLPGLG